MSRDGHRWPRLRLELHDRSRWGVVMLGTSVRTWLVCAGPLRLFVRGTFR